MNDPWDPEVFLRDSLEIHEEENLTEDKTSSNMQKMIIWTLKRRVIPETGKL